MFEPNYQISPFLLERIKEITLLVHVLNQRLVSEVVLVQMLAEARAVSTYASTSIEGNPLPLTQVKRLLKNQPKQLRDSEREVVNYNQVLTWLNAETDKALTLDLLLKIHAGVVKDLLPAHHVGQLRQDLVVVMNRAVAMWCISHRIMGMCRS